MAKLIRSNGFDTVVNGQCLSACTDMFLGGNGRYLSGEGQLGYHAASVSDAYMASVPDIYILELGQFIGVNEVLFGLQYITPGSHINFVQLLFDVHERDDSSVIMYPSPKQLFAAGITTRL